MQLLGISKRRAKAGKRKEIPPSTSRPVQPGKPPNLPVFIAPSPISTLSLQTTTPSSCSSHQPFPSSTHHPVSDPPMSIPQQPYRHRDPREGSRLGNLSTEAHTSKVVAKSLRAEPRPIVCRRPARRRCCPGLGSEHTQKPSDQGRKKPVSHSGRLLGEQVIVQQQGQISVRDLRWRAAVGFLLGSIVRKTKIKREHQSRNAVYLSMFLMGFLDGRRSIKFVYKLVSLPVTQKIPQQNTHHNRVLVHITLSRTEIHRKARRQPF